jgi:Zn finger protein HypA/HybF involved in hydrogenase expression
MVRVVSDKPIICKKTVCYECGFELEYNRIDVCEGTRTFMIDTETYYYIKCPNCGKNTDVKPWP